MSLVLRTAEPRDAMLVLDLVRELSVYERLSHEVDATSRHFEQALFGPNPRVFCELAEWDGEAAGFALWFYSFSSFRGRHGIYLEDVFVRPHLRGNGIGTALLRGLAQRCAAENLARLEWSVLDWNESALRFYRAIGAVPMEGWTVQRLDGEALTALGAQP